jgi:hypothetical protein
MGKFKLRLGAVALCVGLGSAALAAGYFTNGVPVAGGSQYPSTIPLTGNETIPADTNLTGGANPASEAITTLQLQGYVGGGPNKHNVLIGGDATTNLFQRGTTGGSTSSTTPIYGPDRWAYWSGASTAVTLSRDSTAADIPSGFKYGFIFQRTASQTGILPVCMAQEVASNNSYQFQGQVAEFDFHAIAGANFSAASSNITASIVYGTGQDQGVASLQAGTWTGQTNASAAVIPISTTTNRYTVFGSIPATATEIAVQICFTPVGTAGTTDAISVAGLQLTRNAAGLAYVNTTTGYLASAVPATSFERRNASLEASLQYAYYYQINEANTANVIQGPGGFYDTTTTCSIAFPFPAAMRAVPTFLVGNLAATTFKIAPTTTPVVLATPFGALQTGSVSTTYGAVSFKTTAETQYVNCDLVSTAAGAGEFGFSAEL